MRFSVAIFVAALAAAGCGGNDSNTSTDSLSSGSSATTGGSTSGGDTSTGGTSSGSGTGGDTSGGSSGGGSAVDPMVARTTYQAPGSVSTYDVPSSNGGGDPTMQAYAYTALDATDGWSPLQTVPYPIIDLARADQLTLGSYADDSGETRTAYRFTIGPGDSPSWGGAPRVEFDSASGPVQNPKDGLPSANGWADGVVAQGMEMWFSWSMYLEDSFSLTQPWATLFQLHPGNTNWDAGSPQNAWPNPGWPGVIVNSDKIAFGLGPNATSPGEVWTADLADLRGKWTDFAIHANFSTGGDGFMEFYVNGQLVGTATGSNLVYGTTGGTPPWYYMKQGYYRDAGVSSTDSVYQTPILVSIKQG